MAELAAAANGNETVGVTPPGLDQPRRHHSTPVSTQVMLAAVVAVRVRAETGSAEVAIAIAASNGR